MLFSLAKAIHIVGFISWFTGLFAIVRLYVYHAESSEKPPEQCRVLREQNELMQARMWKIITTPAMVVTIVAGMWTAHEAYGLPQMPPWLHLKIGLIVGLLIYHHMCGRIRKQQAAGTSTWTGHQLRVFNEGATMFMAAIVFLAVFKTTMSALWGAVGLLALGVTMMMGIRLYRRVRERASS